MITEYYVMPPNTAQMVLDYPEPDNCQGGVGIRLCCPFAFHQLVAGDSGCLSDCFANGFLRRPVSSRKTPGYEIRRRSRRFWRPLFLRDLLRLCRVSRRQPSTARSNFGPRNLFSCVTHGPDRRRRHHASKSHSGGCCPHDHRSRHIRDHCNSKKRT